MNGDKKIMVRVILPVSGISHDVLLPSALRIQDVVPTLVEMLKQMHEGGLLLSGEHLLCRSETGEPLNNPEMTLEACGVRDADILYLV